MRASVASAHLPTYSLPVWASVPSLCALCAGSRLQDQLWPLKPLPGSEKLPTQKALECHPGKELGKSRGDRR